MIVFVVVDDKVIIKTIYALFGTKSAGIPWSSQFCKIRRFSDSNNSSRRISAKIFLSRML